MNLPFLLKAYHQNNLPYTPDNVRYDLCTLAGSVGSRKNKSLGGDDRMTFVTGALNSDVFVTEDWATFSAMGEHPPFATTTQFVISTDDSYSAMRSVI